MSYGVYDTQIEQRLIAKLRAAIEDRSAAVLTGLPPDYAAYRYECGKLDGLQDAVDMLGQVRSEIFGGNQKEKN